MPPIGPRDFTMPLAAFGMVFVLGSFIYSSIGEAKSIAASRRLQTHTEILESRKRLGMDAWDQRKERERLRSAGSTKAEKQPQDRGDAI